MDGKPNRTCDWNSYYDKKKGLKIPYYKLLSLKSKRWRTM